MVEDLAQSILQLCDAPIDVEFMEKLPAANYGFPCGFRKDFHAERAKIPEALFDLKYFDSTPEEKNCLINVSQIVMTSCGMCDIDIRPVWYFGMILFFVLFLWILLKRWKRKRLGEMAREPNVA